MQGNTSIITFERYLSSPNVNVTNYAVIANRIQSLLMSCNNAVKPASVTTFLKHTWAMRTSVNLFTPSVCSKANVGSAMTQPSSLSMVFNIALVLILTIASLWFV